MKEVILLDSATLCKTASLVAESSAESMASPEQAIEHAIREWIIPALVQRFLQERAVGAITVIADQSTTASLGKEQR
jgi:hypothetical protein